VALTLKALKVWLVASARKAQVLRELLIVAQYDRETVNAIVAPAGQPIGALTPEEIALSVLASVVAVRRAAHGAADAHGAARPDAAGRDAAGHDAAAHGAAGADVGAEAAGGTPTATKANERTVTPPAGLDNRAGGAPPKCCGD